MNFTSMSNFMPHGHCYFWRPDILWMHVISDSTIALAYFCIPLILLYFIRNKRTELAEFSTVLYLFAAFIYLCGISHIFGIITVWKPIYFYEGLVKSATGIVSVLTVIALVPAIPRALKLKSFADELTLANTELGSEIELKNQVQHKLSNAIATLEASNKELEDITSIAAHDLQAPVRRMMAYIDVLKDHINESGNMDDVSRDFFEKVDKNGAHISQQILQILKYSSLVPEDRKHEVTDTRALIEGIIDEIGSGNTAIEYESKFSEMPILNTSSNLLGHVFRNLIENAFKYHSPARKLSLRICASKEKDDQDKNLWTFTVEDNGIGIDRNDYRKLFKLFGRLHSQESYPGTGIGLATVKKLLDKNSGKIWVESEKGQGARFIFTIPENKI